MMLYVYLDEPYRYEANAIIKLFFTEKRFIYINTVTSTENDILRCRIIPSDKKQTLLVTIENKTKTMYKETMEINSTRTPFHSHLKMPMKILIYKVLSQYTGKSLPWGVLTGIRPGKIVHKLMDEGKTHEEIQKKLLNYYQLSHEKARLITEVTQNERSILKKDRHRVSVYIGIPFCTSRCLYCSFPSFSIRQCGYLVPDYLKMLKKEVQWTADWIRKHKLIIDTVYIGGGTPTALSERDLEYLLNDIVPCLETDYIREYTLEAGRPDTINRVKLETIKKAGVTRISINPQTMQNKTLQRIGRNHTAAQVEQAFHTAREVGWKNINMDLIAGLPGEGIEAFENTLQRIGEFKPESITVHTLAVKRASNLHNRKESFIGATDDRVSKMIGMAESFIRQQGMRPYYLYRQKNILENLENVGYAKPGYEGIYNILIMEETQSILALGAGATSKIVYPGNHIERIFNVKNVEQYIDRINEMIERKEKSLCQNVTTT